MGYVAMKEPEELRSFLDNCYPAPYGLAGSASIEGDLPYEYELDDLYYLYSTVRRTSCVSVLGVCPEFG